MVQRQCIVMVGISGSGKSTRALELSEDIRNSCPKYDELGHADVVDIISSDAIRDEILGDEGDQSQNDKVFREVYKRMREGIEHYHHVIVDATNMNVKDRKTFHNTFNSVHEKYTSHYNRIAYVMTTSKSIALKRNKKRARVVPEFVIDRQISKFEIPFYEEGFDIIYFDGYDKINSSRWYGANEDEIKFIEGRMEGFNQETRHHKYTLDVHCQKCAEEMKKRTDNEVLIRAARVHDIGKVFTKKLKDDGSGDYCYYSHHNVGTYLLLQNLDLVGFKDIRDTVDVLFYINFHMQPFFIQTEKAKEKWKKIWGEIKYNNLMMFNECDIIATGRKE